jgi:hypothetical protein
MLELAAVSSFFGSDPRLEYTAFVSGERQVRCPGERWTRKYAVIVSELSPTHFGNHLPQFFGALGYCHHELFRIICKKNFL